MTIAATEHMLEQKYVGNIVRYDRIGKRSVYGRLESVGIETWKKPPIVILNIDEIRYEVELEDIVSEEADFESLLTLL